VRRALLTAAAVALLAAPLAGCATARSAGWVGSWWVQSVSIRHPDGSTGAQEVRYRAGDLGSGWEDGPAPPGDFAFYNPSLGATVYADTSCGRKYDDAPLHVLSNHLTMGFEDVERRSQTELELSGRAGLERLSAARLDGVPVSLATTVIKKGPCVFDLVLVSTQDGFERSLEDYRRFRDGFDAEVGGP